MSYNDSLPTMALDVGMAPPFQCTAKMGNVGGACQSHLLCLGCLGGASAGGRHRRCGIAGPGGDAG